ncbi:MAG: DUF1553 domain-containing protein [Planctomycetaceae bacterium]
MPPPASHMVNPNWLWSRRSAKGWSESAFDQTGWKPAVVIAPADGGPWNLAASLVPSQTDRDSEQVRAAWSVATNLLRALGRPNREQVVTRRDTWATTLQGLELTNGSTLHHKLVQGAHYWDSQKLPAAELISRLYMAALSRPPTEAERNTAESLLGKPIEKQGLEDLMWVLVMLDEFQLIY